MAIVEAFYGVRPEETYQLLQDLRKYFKTHWLLVLMEIAKGGTEITRKINHRVAALVWWKLVIDFDDPTRTNFCPTENGEVVDYNEAQNNLNEVLHEARAEFGIVGRLKREGLRKSFLSHCMALYDEPADRELIVNEAGHVTGRTIKNHYDASWDRHEGLEYANMLPPGIIKMPKGNLFAPFGKATGASLALLNPSDP